MEETKAAREAFVFTFLRHPLDRMRSLYRFAKHLPEPERTKALGDAKLSAMLPSMSPLEFFTNSHPRLRWDIDNFMVRQFSGTLHTVGTKFELDRAMIDKAKQNLASLHYVGLHESYDADFREIVRLISLPQPEIIPRMNVTSSLMRSTSRSKTIDEPFDETVLATLEPLIRGDRELYDFAKALRSDSVRS